jgi:hypothetical protein
MYPVKIRFKKREFFGVIGILIFMDVLGGFRFAAVAPPHAISLKKVSTRVVTPEVRFWISGGLWNPLIPMTEMAPGPWRSRHIVGLFDFHKSGVDFPGPCPFQQSRKF